MRRAPGLARPVGRHAPGAGLGLHAYAGARQQRSLRGAAPQPAQQVALLLLAEDVEHEKAQRSAEGALQAC